MLIIHKNGKIDVPEEDRFIGYAGDHFNKTIELQMEGVADVSWNYRMYLQFDDGTINYFLLEKKSSESHTMLTWNISEDQIYKSGIVYMQVKAFYQDKIIFHTESVPLMVGTSIEFGEYYAKKENSEFLGHEKTLNHLLDSVKNAKAFLPYIGSNGNWFVYHGDTETFEDTRITAMGSAEKYPIDAAVTAKAEPDHVPSTKSVYNYCEELKKLQQKLYSAFVTRAFDISGSLAASETGTVLSANGNFAGKTNIETVCIANAVKTVETGAFKGCTGLKRILVYNSESNLIFQAGALPASVRITYLYSEVPEKNQTELLSLSTKVGDLSYLSTKDKTSVVQAVNELNAAKLSNAFESVSQTHIQNEAVSAEKTNFVSRVNLFDKNNVIQGKTPVMSAAAKYTDLTAAEEYITTNYKLPVQPGDIFSTNEFWVSFYIYNSDGYYITRFASGTDKTFTMPENAAFVLLNLKSKLSNTTVVVKGDRSPVEYIPHTKLDMDLYGYYTKQETEQLLRNTLYGKTLYCDGDSVAKGAERYSYCDFIADQNNMVITQAAISGTTLARQEGKNNSILERVLSMNGSYDYILLEGGFNDMFLNLPLGTLSDNYDGIYSETTVIGALESICCFLMNQYFESKKLFVLGHRKIGVWAEKQSKYWEAIVSVLKKWGIPYVNLREETNLCGWNDAIGNQYFTEANGTHPKKAAYEQFYIPLITAKLKSL